MTDAIAGATTGEITARARRGLAIYLGMVLAVSGVLEWMLVRSGQSIREQLTLAVLNMWVPALASVVARLVLRESFSDVSFRWGGRAGTRAVIISWLYPLVVCGIAYGVAWASGLAPFASTPLKPPFAAIAQTSALGRFAFRLLLSASVGVPLAALSAAGEEIGWRGYMLTRLIDARVPRPVLVSALIWGAWHAPLILSGSYASGPSPLLSFCLFLLQIIAASYVVARQRLETGSLWPAIVNHAAWNAIIQGPFERATPGLPSGPPSLWVGESGILVGVVALAVAAVLVRGAWKIKPGVLAEPGQILYASEV